MALRMPRLKPRHEKPAASTLPTEAICIESHRPWAISDFIERGTRLPLDHPAVRANPQFFKGLVSLTRKEVNDG